MAPELFAGGEIDFATASGRRANSSVDPGTGREMLGGAVGFHVLAPTTSLAKPTDLSRAMISFVPTLCSHVRPDQLERDGFCLLPEVLPTASVKALSSVIDRVDARRWEARADGTRFAIRNAHLCSDELKTAVYEGGLVEIARAQLGPRAAPVSATVFDKPAGAKWYVPSHQDVVHPVSGLVPEGAGFRARPTRAGVSYATLPEALLKHMLAIRVHIDDCPELGALEVKPGSHERLLSNQELGALSGTAFVTCPGGAGAVLLMRPLLVHRSRRSAAEVRRRVLHLVFAGVELPHGLRWTWT